jgi:AraC family transcriptional regulator
LAPPEPRRISGDFIAWPGGAIFVGEGSSQISPHAHYSIQCVIGLPQGLRLSIGRKEQWFDVPGALIPSRAMHTIDTSRCGWGAVMFIEPETVEGNAISQRLQRSHEVLAEKEVARFAVKLEQAWRRERSREAVSTTCREWVRELAGTVAPPPPDARVLAAIERISMRSGAEPTLESLAAQAYLSPSRFRHLFVATVGMPLRTYLLWRRLLRAWEQQMLGDSITDAAHAAGFADAAHLSRTSRVMFGLPQSAVMMNGPISQGCAPRHG